MGHRQGLELTGLRFEPLGSHDRAAFSCGNNALDLYLKNQASQDVRKRAAVVYVASTDGKAILGYYALSQYSVQLNDIPAELVRKFPRYPAIPATLLGRLARDLSVRAKGIGELLLLDALSRALQLSKQVASAAVVTDAKDQRAVDFYRHYGFIQLPKTERRLFLPMSTIAALFSR